MSKGASGVDHVDGMLPIRSYSLMVYSTFWLCMLGQ